MSLTSAERDGTVGGASLGLVAAPKLVLGRYAQWRPQMETALMRAGIAVRDYSEENADWAELTAAVEEWTKTDERASINFALGRGAGSASSKGAGPSAADKEARRGAMEAVARGRKAYAHERVICRSFRGHTRWGDQIEDGESESGVRARIPSLLGGRQQRQGTVTAGRHLCAALQHLLSFLSPSFSVAGVLQHLSIPAKK
jgi:hypothetical protein